MSIALSAPDITGAERRAVQAVLRGRQLALGPQVTRFEQAVASYVGARYAVAVNSGTSGLHLIVRALDLKPGDEVITTPFSFVASANCLVYEGVKPVFADVDARTLNLDPEQVERRITPRTRAILAVDVFGHPADWPALQRIGRRHRLMLIEDSCEALGAELRGRRCGTFGDAAAFAFYPNKQITTGEGGMVVTNRTRVAALCRSMANQGRRVSGGAWLEHVRLGYNYRMSDINAALGCAQMDRIDEILKRRQRVADWYQSCLADVPGIRIPETAPGARMSWFVYVVRLAAGCGTRNRVLRKLRSRGLQCSDYFRPIHLMPFYRDRFGCKPGDFPVTEAAAARTVALPFHSAMTRRDVETVAAGLSDALRTTGNGG